MTNWRLTAWTDEEKALLETEWLAGKSAKRIADMLPNRTKNGVIGQVHRMNLPGRPSPIKRQRPGLSKRIHRKFFGKPRFACEYINWDGQECGKPRVERSSYCEEHKKLCSAGKPKRTGKPFTHTPKGLWA